MVFDVINGFWLSLYYKVLLGDTALRTTEKDAQREGSTEHRGAIPVIIM
jgi:hypothetical protein